MRRVSTRNLEPPQARPHLLPEKEMRQQEHLLGLCLRVIPGMILQEAKSLCPCLPPKSRPPRTAIGAALSPPPTAFSQLPRARRSPIRQSQQHPLSNAGIKNSLPPLPLDLTLRTGWSGGICHALE